MSKAIFDIFQGPNNSPAKFPFGFTTGTVSGNINNIGLPGGQGFGVGICPGPLPVGMAKLSGCDDPASDNHGNYVFTDGSVMCWIPAFFYKWGTGSNGLAINAVSIKAFADYADVATANAAGYALHRAFYDGGAVQYGVFIDKYLCSNNGGIASSLKNGNAVSSALRGSLANDHFSHLTGNSQTPADTLGGALAAAKSRGNNFFCNTRFIFEACAMLSYAHGAASSSVTFCAWYSAGATNFPKGCNNDALRDVNDTSILYIVDGNGTYNCGKTGSANLFARTAHNGQNCGVVDLNGVLNEVTPGLTSNGTNLYILKPAAQAKALTGGNAGALDIFGATGIAALYDDLGTTYQSLTKTGGWVNYGSATQVFSEATSGNAWNACGFGIPLLGGTGGTNAFGNDGCYQPAAWPNELCPASGGIWSFAAPAGVWCANLNGVRTTSDASFGFRSALYL